MKPNEITSCGFAQRELAGADYWKDPKWKEVTKLRNSKNPDDHGKANSLVFQIREDWGVD